MVAKMALDWVQMIQLLNYMLSCDIVGKLANLLFFVVGSSKIRIVILKICRLGLIVQFGGCDSIEHRIVMFDIFSVLGDYTVFYRLQLHNDFAPSIVFVDLY